MGHDRKDVAYKEYQDFQYFFYLWPCNKTIKTIQPCDIWKQRTSLQNGVHWSLQNWPLLPVNIFTGQCFLETVGNRTLTDLPWYNAHGKLPSRCYFTIQMSITTTGCLVMLCYQDGRLELLSWKIRLHD